MDVEIKFLKAFKDGNIFPETMKIYQTVTVSESVLSQIRNSGGQVEVIQRIIPTSTYREKPKKKNEEA